MNPITGLLTALGALTVVYVALWAKAVAAARRVMGRQQDPATDARVPTAVQVGLGAVTNFFDALGIGSFATTTAAFKFLKMVPDRIIPGTLNAGHTLPTVTQAFIFIAFIPADVTTLFSMIAAAVLGAWLGAGIIARWPKRKVQIGMGAALLAAAVFFTMRNLSLFPTPEIEAPQTVPADATEVALPGDLVSRMFTPTRVTERPASSGSDFVEVPASQWSWSNGRITLPKAAVARELMIEAAPVGVRGVRLALAVAGNFFLGALMSLGIGLYAPCMILVGLLGMSEKTAFPIMMGSCAFLMPVGSLKFIKEKAYSLRPAIGLALGGIPGVLVAGLIVKELPLYWVRWLVIVVVIYTAAMMLMSAFSRDSAAHAE
jgi:uncharacterized membrane protein YfcA